MWGDLGSERFSCFRSCCFGTFAVVSNTKNPCVMEGCAKPTGQDSVLLCMCSVGFCTCCYHTGFETIIFKSQYFPTSTIRCVAKAKAQALRSHLCVST